MLIVTFLREGGGVPRGECELCRTWCTDSVAAGAVNAATGDRNKAGDVKPRHIRCPFTVEEDVEIMRVKARDIADNQGRSLWWVW